MKVTPFVFDIWMSILKQVPRSVMWLLPPASGFELLRKRAKSHGVDPRRLILSHYSTDYPLHIKRCKLAHLLLDTGQGELGSLRFAELCCDLQRHTEHTQQPQMCFGQACPLSPR